MSRGWFRCVGLCALIVNGLCYSVARGETLTGDDKLLVEALLDTQAEYLKSVENGQMSFSTKVSEADNSFKSVKGVATWSKSRLRIDYDWEQVVSGHETLQKSGALFEKPNLRIDFDKTKNIAYRSGEQRKDYGREFFVIPKRGWFDYNFEFALRELITADETWDYGLRTVRVERNDQTIVLTIDNPSTVGDIRFTFDKTKGRLLTEVIHTNETGVRYRCEYDWVVDGANIEPVSIKHFGLSKNGTEYPSFELLVEEFKASGAGDPALLTITESSLGIDKSTTVVTYRPGRPPLVREPKVPESDELKNLGKSLRNRGFAKEPAESE